MAAAADPVIRTQTASNEATVRLNDPLLRPKRGVFFVPRPPLHPTTWSSPVLANRSIHRGRGAAFRASVLLALLVLITAGCGSSATPSPTIPVDATGSL